MRARLVNESRNYTSFAQQEWDRLTQEQKLDIALQFVKDPDDAEFYSTIEDVNDLPDDIGTNVRGYIDLSDESTREFPNEQDDEYIEDEENNEESGIPDHYPENPKGDWNWR